MANQVGGETLHRLRSVENPGNTQHAREAQVAQLLGAFDAQTRHSTGLRLPEGAHEDEDGFVYRIWGGSPRGFVSTVDIRQLDDEELDELIRSQIEFFRDRADSFEWKTFSHDGVPQLAERLLAHGFLPEERESLLIGELSAIDHVAKPPAGVTIRQVESLADTKRMADLLTLVSGTDHSFLGQFFYRERQANPEYQVLLVAEAEGMVVSLGRLTLGRGSEFASLWSGATHPEWRHRGIYRALVAHRARLAAERSCRYLQVDASEESRPILERLGFIKVGDTTPYVWSNSNR